MARERLSTSTSSSQNVPPASAHLAGSSSKQASRLPVKSKRPVLGERVENLEHATPRQHLVKSGKSVVKPRLSASVTKSTASLKGRSPTIRFSPSTSQASTPAGANVSRPGSTPHPRRSSMRLDRLLQDGDDTMLIDMRAQEYLLSESEASEAGDGPWPPARTSGRGVVGAGRLMTPENSQENRANRDHEKQMSPPRTITRLPTPPSSQTGTADLPVTRTLIRPRPEPTPPRHSASSWTRLNDSLAPPASNNASPNPRRRKSPRVGEEETPRLRSPFDAGNTSTPTSSGKAPHKRMEVVIERPRKTASKSPLTGDVSSTTPRPQAATKDRPSTRTPRLSQSTSSRASKTKQAPATAPPANRRKSMSQAKAKKPSPPRRSLPAPKKGRSSLSTSLRKSVTQGKGKKMVGILPEPVEQGSPSDDPLLLIEDDETSWGTPSASSQSRPRSTAKRSKPSSTARIIDFDSSLAHDAARSALSRNQGPETFQDYQIPVQGSEPDYDDMPVWGNESDGGSDMEDVGNDTFAHVTGGSAMQMIGEDSLGLSVQDPDSSEGHGSGTRSPSLSASLLASEPAGNHGAAQEGEDVQSDIQDLVNSPAEHAETTTPVQSPIRDGFYSQTPARPEQDRVSPPMAAPGSQTPRSVMGLRSPSAAPTSPGTLVGNTTPVGLRAKSFSPFASPAPTLPLPRTSASETPSGLSPVHGDDAAVGSLLRGVGDAGAKMSSTSKPQISESFDINSPSSLHSPAPRASSTTSPANWASADFTRSRTTSPVTIAPADDIPSSPLSSPKGHTPSSREHRSSPLSPITLPLEMRTESPPLGALGLFLDQEYRDPTPVSLGEPESAWHTSPVNTPVKNDVVGTLADEEVDENVADSAIDAVSTTPLGQPPSSFLPLSPRVPKSPLPSLAEPSEDVPSIQHECARSTLTPSDRPTELGGSTTPLGSPPVNLARSPIRQPFSPRYASPLRAVHARPLSPVKIVEVPHHHFPSPVRTEQIVLPVDEEPTEDPSLDGDVTLEGDSLDWSLSEGEELPQTRQTADESATETTSVSTSAKVDSADSADEDAASSSGEDQQDMSTAADTADADLPSCQTTTAAAFVEGFDTPADDESDVSEDGNPEHEAIDGVALDTLPGSSDASLDDEVVIDSADVTIEGDSGDWSSPDETASEDDEEEGDEEEGRSPTKEDSPAPQTPDELDHSAPDLSGEAEEGQSLENDISPDPNRKIILRLVSVGTIKIEADGNGAPPTPPRTARLSSSHTEEEGAGDDQFSDVPVSTTPTYDPPSRPVFGQYASPSRAPAHSLSRGPERATPPPVLRRLSLANAAAVPSLESMLRHQVSSAGRPSSRLSRQVAQRDDDHDDAERSIRVRSRPSLGDELYDADDSMRSVVEVSSLDPKAAARAAAILKMNHAYIEHGDLTKIDKSQRPTTPRRKSFHTPQSRRMDKTELLHEAELEIVSTRRSRSRSMSRFRGVSETPTELPLPGAWNGTPKRKRAAPSTETIGEDVAPTKAWGVSQWKKLEKVFRAERELWIKEREFKSMPGGFIGWARRSTFGSPAPVLKEWDPMRVVSRFVDEQKVAVGDQVGEWSVDMLRTRVEALERHAEHRKVKDRPEAAFEIERSPKKAKMATPVKATRPAVPQSSVRRMFNWALGSSVRGKSGLSTSGAGDHDPLVSSSIKQTRSKGSEVNDDTPILDSPRMAQIGAQSVTTSTPPRPRAALPSTGSFSIPHPSSPLWRPSEPVRPPTARPAPVSSLLGQTRPTPRTLSAILAASSTSSTGSYDGQASTSRLYPSLEPSMSQRSAAINALFTPGDKSTSASASTSSNAGVPIKRSSSVKDLVKSFEDSGILSRGSDLRRAQSRPV